MIPVIFMLLTSCFDFGTNTVEKKSVATFVIHKEDHQALADISLESLPSGWFLTIGPITDAVPDEIKVTLVNKGSKVISVNSYKIPYDKTQYLMKNIPAGGELELYSGSLDQYQKSWSLSVSSTEGENLHMIMKLSTKQIENLPKLSVDAKSMDGP